MQLIWILCNISIQDFDCIKISAETLFNFYNVDLSPTFGDELIPDDFSKQCMYNNIFDKNVRDQFPNMEIALKMYLTSISVQAKNLSQQ